MDDKLPTLLEKEEELVDIEPVELDLKGEAPEEEENVRWKGHPHIASRLWTIMLSLILVVAGLIATPIGILTSSGSFIMYVGPSLFLVGLVSLIFVYIHIKFTRYVITDSAVYKQVGIITDNVTKIPIDKLQSLMYRQSISEKLLNFGTVGMSTGGQEVIELEFESVKNPSDVHDRIDSLMEERIERNRTVTLDDQSKQIRDLEEQLNALKDNVN